MDVPALRRYRAIRRNDIVAALAAMVGVLVLGPLYGLLVAIGLAVLGLVYRSSRVDVEVMGRVPGEKAAWGGMRNHPERRPTERRGTNHGTTPGRRGQGGGSRQDRPRAPKGSVRGGGKKRR